MLNGLLLSTKSNKWHSVTDGLTQTLLKQFRVPKGTLYKWRLVSFLFGVSYFCLLFCTQIEAAVTIIFSFSTLYMVTKEHIVGCIAKPPVGTSSAPTPPTTYIFSSQYIHTLNIRPSLEDSKYIAAISGLHKEIFVANLCTYRYKILVWSSNWLGFMMTYREKFEVLVKWWHG